MAKYAGLSRIKVWLHLKPGAFRRLPTTTLGRYADVFDISVEALKSVPEAHGPGSRNR